MDLLKAAVYFIFIILKFKYFKSGTIIKVLRYYIQINLRNSRSENYFTLGLVFSISGTLKIFFLIFRNLETNAFKK